MQDKYKSYKEELERILKPDKSFDLIRRRMKSKSGRSMTFFYIDGFTKDMVMQKMMEYFIKVETVEDLTVNIPYVEVELTDSIDTAVRMVLSGSAALLAEGIDKIIILDTREYPVRSIQEPENDRVLRGPRDGFCETLIFNTALIRRRVRDPDLVMDVKNIGEKSRTDVVLCYIEGRANADFVKKVSDKLDNMKIGSLNMTSESIAELLVPNRRWNPFPKLRYTERPDAAAAMLMEGSVLILCDNNPSAIMLPVSIFDFAQESDDYYFPPFIGTYLRILRQIVFFATIFLSPVWYYLAENDHILPRSLEFLAVSKEDYAVPLFWQFILVELAIDGLKMASLNTPSSLSGSLSVVSGLILGEYAVEAGWLVSEVILYMSFVSLANFTQPSFELGYAFKFSRIFMLICTALFGLYGLVGGAVVMVVFIACNKTVDGNRGYLYPLIPFNARALKRLFLRAPLK